MTQGGKSNFTFILMVYIKRPLCMEKRTYNFDGYVTMCMKQSNSKALLKYVRVYACTPEWSGDLNFLILMQLFYRKLMFLHCKLWSKINRRRFDHCYRINTMSQFSHRFKGAFAAVSNLRSKTPLYYTIQVMSQTEYNILNDNLFFCCQTTTRVSHKQIIEKENSCKQNYNRN